MAIDGRQVDIDLDNNLIVGFALAKSPKYYIANQIQEVAALHRRIKRRLRTKPVKPK